jgi:hypothetical protein
MSEPEFRSLQRAADYALLLRDGAVMWRGSRGDDDAWFEALRRLAAEDGLPVGLTWATWDRIPTPCAEIRRRDGRDQTVTRDCDDQDELGALTRPFVELDWGDVLRAARKRAGIGA